MVEESPVIPWRDTNYSFAFLLFCTALREKLFLSGVESKLSMWGETQILRLIS